MGIFDAASVILDSSVWVAFLRDTDSQREKAKRMLDNLRDAAVVVPEYVLVEVMEDGRAFLPAGESLAHATTKLFLKRERDHLSFTDTALLVLSEQYRVITFDRRLQKAIDKARN
jgi:predicted nucleic acid-binding protein